MGLPSLNCNALTIGIHRVGQPQVSLLLLLNFLDVDEIMYVHTNLVFPCITTELMNVVNIKSLKKIGVLYLGILHKVHWQLAKVHCLVRSFMVINPVHQRSSISSGSCLQESVN